MDWHAVVVRLHVHADLPVYHLQAVSLGRGQSMTILPRHAGHRFVVSVQ